MIPKEQFKLLWLDKTSTGFSKQLFSMLACWFWITEFQSGWGWKKPLVQIPYSSRDTYRQVNVQEAFDYPQGQGLCNLGGQPVPVLGDPDSKYFLMFRWSLLCFSLCPLPLVLLLCMTGKRLALLICTSFSGDIYTHWWDQCFSPTLCLSVVWVFLVGIFFFDAERPFLKRRFIPPNDMVQMKQLMHTYLSHSL